MRKFTTSLFLVAALALISNFSFAQLSVTGQVSGLKFMGDVGKKGNANYFSDMRLGYGLGLEYRIGKILGVGLEGLFGKLAGTDNDKTSHANFQTNITGGALNVFAFFDKLGDKPKQVSPFVHAGIGYLMFDAYGDLKNKSNLPYYYWSDGSIKDLPESTPTPSLATTIRRDYTYETQLKDSATAYSRSSLYIPIGFGLKFNVGYRTSIRIGATYNIVMSDWVDNVKKGGGDSWLAGNIGLNVHFGKKPKDAFSGVDFAAVDNSDTDEDGVKDDIDKCLGTPKGVKVDSKGCPDDKDEDGVFDYMDKELTTKKGAKVDADGITIDEAELAKRQLQWDSLATVRSEGFNNNPSSDYLQSIENQSKANANNGTKPAGNSKLPAEFQPADYDGDGYISAKEITKTIDGFFEGESSFTVEKINKLIDFFFEQ